MKNLNTILNKKLKDRKFKKVFNEYEKEFQIAQELIMLRTRAGLTQSELAKKTNTSQSAIARLESGEHKNVTIAFLKKLGNALGAVPEIHFKKVHSLNRLSENAKYQKNSVDIKGLMTRKTAKMPIFGQPVKA